MTRDETIKVLEDLQGMYFDGMEGADLYEFRKCERLYVCATELLEALRRREE
jgi:hypothetical protein